MRGEPEEDVKKQVAWCRDVYGNQMVLSTELPRYLKKFEKKTATIEEDEKKRDRKRFRREKDDSDIETDD